ncbi:MAG: hypothetical protein ACOYNL_10310 [Rickettsiales bacterium]
MAEGPSCGPDLQALIRASQPQKEGQARLFGLINDAPNPFSQLAMQSAAPGKFDCKIIPKAPPKQGALGALCKQMGLTREAFANSIFEDCKKATQGVNVVYSGDLPAGAPVSAPQVASASSGGVEIG